MEWVGSVFKESDVKILDPKFKKKMHASRSGRMEDLLAAHDFIRDRVEESAGPVTRRKQKMFETTNERRKRNEIMKIQKDSRLILGALLVAVMVSAFLSHSPVISPCRLKK